MLNVTDFDLISSTNLKKATCLLLFSRCVDKTAFKPTWLGGLPSSNCTWIFAISGS